MAEGDSIRRLADRLHDRAAGQVVVASTVRHARWATADLAGLRVDAVDAVGKHLLIRLDAPDGTGWTVHSHLRMSGRWTFGVPPRTPPHRRRIELHLADGGALVGTDLPVLHIGRRAQEAEWVGHLGPDLCGRVFDAGAAAANLRGADPAPLGGALLDQRLLAGIGNLYAVEIPFLLGVSPWTPTGDVEGLAVVVRLARALLPANVAVGRQSTTGRTGRRELHWIYNRSGRRCAVCTARLAGDEAPPWGRRTWWCPTCQHEPAADLDRARHLLRHHRLVARALDADPAAGATGELP